MGQSYWDQMQDFLRQTLLPEKTIGPDDLALFQCTYDPGKAVEIITTGCRKLSP
jgi:predicted Rossmann-fold nucleotide-binding protein